MSEIGEFKIATLPAANLLLNDNVEIGARTHSGRVVVGEIIGEFGIHKDDDGEIHLTHLRTGSTIYYYPEIDKVRTLANALMRKPAPWRNGTFGVRPLPNKWLTQAKALLRAALMELELPFANVSPVETRKPQE